MQLIKQVLHLKIVHHSTCKAEINDVYVDQANCIYIAMPKYYLIGSSDSYSDTVGSYGI